MSTSFLSSCEKQQSHQTEQQKHSTVPVVAESSTVTQSPQWETSFRALISHVLQHKEWPNRGTALYRWILTQRCSVRYHNNKSNLRMRVKKGTIGNRRATERFRRLKGIGFPFSGSVQDWPKPNPELFTRAQQQLTPIIMTHEQTPRKTFQDYFNNLVDHIRQHKAWPTYQNNPKLRIWITHQRGCFRSVQYFSDQGWQRYNQLKELGLNLDAPHGHVFDGKPNLSSSLLSVSTTMTKGTEISEADKDNSTSPSSIVPAPHNPSPILLSPRTEPKCTAERKLMSSTNSTSDLSSSIIAQSLPSSQKQCEQKSAAGKRKRSLEQPQTLCTTAATANNNNDGGGFLSLASGFGVTPPPPPTAAAGGGGNANKRQRFYNQSGEQSNNDNNDDDGPSLDSAAPHRVMPSPQEKQSQQRSVDSAAMWWNISTDSNRPPRKGAARLIHHCVLRYKWDRTLTIRVLEAYRQFMELKALLLESGKSSYLVPSKFVDQMWQQHVLDNAHYRQDCHAICNGQEIYYHEDEDDEVLHTSHQKKKKMTLEECQEKTLVALEARFGPNRIDSEIWDFDESPHNIQDDEDMGTQRSDGSKAITTADDNNNNDKDDNHVIDANSPEVCAATSSQKPTGETVFAEQKRQDKEGQELGEKTAMPSSITQGCANCSQSVVPLKDAIEISVRDKHEGDVICFRLLKKKKISKMFKKYSEEKTKKMGGTQNAEWKFVVKGKDGRMKILDRDATPEALGLQDGDNICAWVDS